MSLRAASHASGAVDRLAASRDHWARLLTDDPARRDKRTLGQALLSGEFEAPTIVSLAVGLFSVWMRSRASSTQGATDCTDHAPAVAVSRGLNGQRALILFGATALGLALAARGWQHLTAARN
ncbi:MAG: hypothetical protein KGQ77_07560 [Betaproteobacteria bacterium]|nr:hypothetical protein [Betaproteobacteria bacterium]